MKIGFLTKWHLEPDSHLEAIKEVVEGMVAGLIRSFLVMGTWLYINIIRPIANIANIHLPEGKHKHIPNGKLKVAAVGFGRTGTYSVTLALEELGFPTLHTIHMYAYENEEILHMWMDKIVEPAMEQKQPFVNTGEADLKLIAESGYQAIADLPMVLFYEQILEEYPDCKFILTTRENSEIWYKSWSTLTKSITTQMFLGGFFFPTVKQYSHYLRWLSAVVNKDASYLTSFFPKHENIKDNAIASYEEHNRRVREIIPKNQLLEYSVKQGWKPLCEFLDIDDNNCPDDTPFPKSNSGRSMQAQGMSAFVVATIIILYLIKHVGKLPVIIRKHKKLD